MTGVLRRKLGFGAAPPMAEGATRPDRALRLALGRAAQAELTLALVVTALREDPRSLAELLELAEPGMFFGVLEGRDDALGLMALAQPVLGAVIEHMTTGAISDAAPSPRKPTRIDAAMAMPLIDRILGEFELALGADTAQDWARGYRYASFLDDPRPLGLLLEDGRYRVFRASVALGRTARQGEVMLALPADPAPATRRGADPAQAESAAFSAVLQGAVLDAPARLDAVLTRIRLPLQAVMGWTPGALIPLPQARPGDMTLEAPRGRVVAQVRLGQCEGARAVRLVPDTLPGSLVTALPDPGAAPPVPPATGLDRVG